MDELERAREFFYNDRFASQAMGAVIEQAGGGKSVCSLIIEDRHLNAINALMGGVAYTLADFAFAVSTNFETELATVTVTSQISYLGVPKSNKIIASAYPLKDGRRTCFYEIDIDDDLGNRVAVVMTTGAHVKKA